MTGSQKAVEQFYMISLPLPLSLPNLIMAANGSARVAVTIFAIRIRRLREGNGFACVCSQEGVLPVQVLSE